MNYFFFLGILAINFIIIIYYSKITKFINIFDKPDKIRKKHNKPVALISFLFIFLSLLCLIINLSNENSLNYLYSRFKIETNKQFFIFLFSFLSITLIGLYDDKFKISVSTKVALLFFVLYINISIDTGLQVKQIYSIYFNKIFLLDNSSIFFTVFCIFALINAMNMFDGANVQAVIYYLLIFLYFLINGLFVDLSLTLFVPLIFILYLNIKNKIFLGDSGIYAITYLVSYILLKSNNLANKIAAEEIIFMFLIPGLEMTRLFIYRLSKNTNPFMADTNHFHHILLSDFKFNSISSSYGYDLLNWLVGRLNLEFYFINILCIILGIFSFHSFKNLPNRWILWVVIFHTGIMILSMGYVRQAFAIFFIIIAINSLIFKKIYYFFFYTTLGFLFHKTSFIFFLLIFFYFEKINYKYFLIILIPTISILILESKSLYKLYYLYVEQSTLRGAGGESLGVYYRLPISIVVAVLFLIYKEHLSKNFIERKIYVFFSFYVFFLIPVSFASTTLADRMLLYSFPLSLVTFCRFENIFINKKHKYIVNILIILIQFTNLFYWSVFSNTGIAWSIYRSYLFYSL